MAENNRTHKHRCSFCGREESEVACLVPSQTGAYICDNPKCVELCIKKRLLNKVFSADIPAEIYTKIGEEYANFKQN